jgi:hypothetical protein
MHGGEVRMTKRPTLHAVKQKAAPRQPAYSQIKKAILQFRRDHVPQKVWRKYVKDWLAMNAWLGDRHLLKGGEPKWGRAGDPVVKQIHAPRRLGDRA